MSLHNFHSKADMEHCPISLGFNCSSPDNKTSEMKSGASSNSDGSEGEKDKRKYVLHQLILQCRFIEVFIIVPFRKLVELALAIIENNSTSINNRIKDYLK